MTVPCLRPMARLATLICAAIVLYLALAPVTGQPPLPHGDKANHVAAFLVLTTLARIGWPDRGAAIVCALLAFGGAIELLQLLTPDHRADWVDLAADVVGIAAGWWVFAWIRRWRWSVLDRRA